MSKTTDKVSVLTKLTIDANDNLVVNGATVAKTSEYLSQAAFLASYSTITTSYALSASVNASLSSYALTASVNATLSNYLTTANAASNYQNKYVGTSDVVGLYTLSETDITKVITASGTIYCNTASLSDGFNCKIFNTDTNPISVTSNGTVKGVYPTIGASDSRTIYKTGSIIYILN